MKVLIRFGLAPKHTYLLTVKGRKSGKYYSTPVTLVEDAQGRWLVAPYGVVDWVRNVRATQKVTLSRAGRAENVTCVEVDAVQSAPVLKKYITNVAITRPYFDVKPESEMNAFVAEAPRHPVFKLQS